MKVQTLIDKLKQYDPQDELVAAFWDKDLVEGWLGQTIEKYHWQDTVNYLESREWVWYSEAADAIIESLKETGE